ncbi:MAG: fumarate reductase subunit C [Burkholderiaceae bacterium]
MSGRPVGVARKPYRRSMRGWWRRDPYFVRYMAREATALAVWVYALVLAVGLVRLAQGEAAWNGYVAALRSPLALLLHVVLLVAMVVHAISWFEIMPKTMPLIRPDGTRLVPQTIQRSGWAAAVVATVVMLALAMWWGRS